MVLNVLDVSKNPACDWARVFHTQCYYSNSVFNTCWVQYWVVPVVVLLRSIDNIFEIPLPILNHNIAKLGFDWVSVCACVCVQVSHNKVGQTLIFCCDYQLKRVHMVKNIKDQSITPLIQQELVGWAQVWSSASLCDGYIALYQCSDCSNSTLTLSTRCGGCFEFNHFSCRW